MGRRWPDEVSEYVMSVYRTTPNKEILRHVNDELGYGLSECGLLSWASYRGVKKETTNGFTDEQNDWLRGFIPGHSEREIADAYFDRYGDRLTRSQVKNRKAALGVNSGTHGGRFEVGRANPMRGKSWDDMGISEEKRERIRSSQYKRGNNPANGKMYPVGSEKVGSNGYIEVKVADLSSSKPHDQWIPKHRLVWEQAHGSKVPDGCYVVFADHDNRNFDPGNLVAVDKSTWVVIRSLGLEYQDADSLRACIALAKLRSKVNEVRNKKRH